MGTRNAHARSPRRWSGIATNAASLSRHAGGLRCVQGCDQAQALTHAEHAWRMSSCRTSAGSSSGVPGRGGEVGDRHRPAGHPRRRGDRRRCAVAGPVGAARHSDAGRRRGSAVGCARRLQRVTTRVVSAALVGHASDQAIGVGPGSTPAPDLTDRSWAPHPREGSGDSRVTPRPRDRRNPSQPPGQPPRTLTGDSDLRRTS